MTPHHIGSYALGVEGKNHGSPEESRPYEEKARGAPVSTTDAAPEDQDEPDLYDIRIKGHLDDRWAARFDGLTITRDDNGTTRLTGPVVDQAALHGLLKRIRDLGTPLLSVTRVEPDQAEAPDVRP